MGPGAADSLDTGRLRSTDLAWKSDLALVDIRQEVEQLKPDYAKQR